MRAGTGMSLAGGRSVEAGGARTAPLLRTALLTGLAAAAINGALYAASAAAGVFPALRLDAAAGPQMAIELVLAVSLFTGLAAIGAFGVVRRVSVTPVRGYVILATVLLLLSLAAPFALPGTLAQKLVLNAMHVVVAALAVGAVVRMGRGT